MFDNDCKENQMSGIFNTDFQEVPMPLIVDNQEFLSVTEACEYLGGISRQTLRIRTKEYGISAYKQGISRNVYYKKSDLDKLMALHPVESDEENSE